LWRWCWYWYTDGGGNIVNIVDGGVASGVAGVRVIVGDDVIDGDGVVGGDGGGYDDCIGGGGVKWG